MNIVNNGNLILRKSAMRLEFLAKKHKLPAFMIMAAISLPAPTKAEIFGGVEFPQGSVSFADAVVSYTPVGPPANAYQGAFNALGIPNYSGPVCSTQAGCTFVSLGQGGSLTLSFVDNKLTGSGNTDFDLWVFEIGGQVEDTFVDLSKDGSLWTSVGKVLGSTSGIDIDALGFTQNDEFGFVRLTDDPNEGGGGVGGTVGADIDAVGAISTVLTPVDPNPSSAPGPIPLLGVGATFSFSRKLRKRIKSSKLPVASAID
jgi:hypothetical protein